MYERIPISGMTEKDWMMLRKTGIGGSDAGAIANVNAYRSAMEVYLDKTTDRDEAPDSEAIRCGHDLEAYVAERFCEATGKKVRKSNYMYRSKKFPFMIADVDRIVVGEDAGLECKTCNAYKASDWANGGIPPSYMLQTYHYMAVTGRKTWYIACLIMGKEFVYRTLTWDDDVINLLIRAEDEFWNKHVVPRIPPAPDGSESCSDALAKLFPSASKKEAIELKGFDDALERRSQIVTEIEKLQSEQAILEQKIKLAMEDHEQGYAGNYRITWSNVESVRLDTKRIKTEMPEVYEEYSKPSIYRKFSVKAA